MRKLILVYGQLAALKTTISKRLASDLGIVCLNKDDIKEILGDTVGYSNREENLKLSAATFYIMKDIANKIINVDGDIIIESNFKPLELEQMYSSSRNNKANVMSIIMTGDGVVRYQRYLARDKDRHPVHKSTGILTEENFLEIKVDFDLEEIYGECVVVDTTEFNDFDYANLKNSIYNFLSK